MPLTNDRNMAILFCITYIYGMDASSYITAFFPRMPSAGVSQTFDKQVAQNHLQNGCFEQGF